MDIRITLVWINKEKTWQLVDFTVLADRKAKVNKSQKTGKIPGFCQRTEEVIIFTQPLRSGRIWHKVNFKAKFNRFEFS